jgi:hypothetical protein
MPCQPCLKLRPLPPGGRILHREPRPQQLRLQDLGLLEGVLDRPGPFRGDEGAEVEGLAEHTGLHGGHGAEEVDVGGVVGGWWVVARLLLLLLLLMG